MSSSLNWIRTQTRTISAALKAPRSEMYRALFLSICIGIAVGILRTWAAYQIRPFLHNGAGDFTFATRIARDLWNEKDPYAYSHGPDSVPYPLPAGIIAMPFALFEDEVASGLFMGCSSFILSLCLLRDGKTWPLLIFLSWPFAYAVLFSQWTPLILSIWFLPFMMPLVLVKPHIAIPLILTGKISKTGLLITIVLLLFSLILNPKWPLTWFQLTSTYKGLPPLFSLPLGPLLLLSLLKYRDRRAWLLLLLALMPQRVLYDQLPLFVLASTGIQAIFLVICSWLTLPVLFTSGGWANVPFNWQFWILLTLYIPAILVLFWFDITGLFKKSIENYRRKFCIRSGTTESIVTGRMK